MASGFFSTIFGAKPDVPTIAKLDLGTEQGKAVANNLAIAPQASKLASLTQDQIMTMLSQVDPGFAGQSAQIGKNISSMLSGEIPTDVSDAVARSSAGKALTGGFGGTEAGGNLTARDLGLTSLNLTREGLSSAESWLASTERLLSPAMATFTGMFVTPQQQYSADNEQNMQQFQQQWMTNQISSMANPASPVAVSLKFCGRDTGAPQSGSLGGGGGGVGGNDWSSGWETAQPMTDAQFSTSLSPSAGMSYDVGNAAATSAFGDAITAPAI